MRTVYPRECGATTTILRPRVAGVSLSPRVRVRVSTTSARDYMTLLAGRAA